MFLKSPKRPLLVVTFILIWCAIIAQAPVMENVILLPEHQAEIIEDLAGLLQAKGDRASAEALYRKALAIREETLGPDHPQTADSLQGL